MSSAPPLLPSAFSIETIRALYDASAGCDLLIAGPSATPFGAKLTSSSLGGLKSA